MLNTRFRDAVETGTVVINELLLHRTQSPSWSIVHVVNATHGDAGIILGYRQGENFFRIILPIRPLIPAAFVYGDRVTLLCVEGSYCLLSLVRGVGNQLSLAFILVHMIRRSAILINCPQPPMIPSALDSDLKNVKLMVNVKNGRVSGVQVVHVHLCRRNNIVLPVMCRWVSSGDSSCGAWSIVDVVRLPESSNVNYQHPLAMMMMGHVSRLASFDGARPVYTETEGGAYGLELPPNQLFIAPPGWQTMTSRYYTQGNSGWGALVTRHLNSDTHRICIIKDIKVLCWQPVTKRYEDVVGGTFPHNQLGKLPINLATSINVDATGSRVQIGMVCRIGLNRFVLHLYIFDHENQTWHFMTTPNITGTRVAKPLITSSLTI